MAYVLTINRVMGLCAFEAARKNQIRGKTRKKTAVNAKLSPEDQRELVKKFHAQMRLIRKGRLPAIYEAIKEVAAQDGLTIEKAKAARESELEITIFQDTAGQPRLAEVFEATPKAWGVSPARDPLIGLFDSRRFGLTIGGMKWDLRIRPSVTACALERADGLTKLWWTFEGVPIDAGEPTERQAIDFINSTTTMAEVALTRLRDAYVLALEKVTEKKKGKLRLADARFRVSLADNTDSRFSKVVDAMYLNRATFEEIKNGKFGDETAKGAIDLLNFIRDASGSTPSDKSIALSTNAPGLAAVYSKVSAEKSAAGKKNFVIAGLANSVDMLASRLPANPGWRRLNHNPDLLRSISAARPLSARLADAGARRLDAAPKSVAPAALT